jgi:mevalonate-3-kinase
MKNQAKAIAYPGLPVIFAEGFKDSKRRISAHNHASLAVTDIHENAKTETNATLTEGEPTFTLDGRTPEEGRALSAIEVVKDMLPLAAERTAALVESHNHNILTGSSDSGAAALVTAIDDLLELGLPMTRLLEISRLVSETAYRSLIGGLSVCEVDAKGGLKARQIRDASFFRDLMIYAIPFPELNRFPADNLHLMVTRHKDYPKRGKQVDERMRNLQNFTDDNDLLGFMKIIEAEATTVHTMFNEMGMQVIKPPMEDAIKLVLGMRERKIPAYWSVAGGSAVYVFTLHNYSREVTRELKDNNLKYRHYKVADGAHPI